MILPSKIQSISFGITYSASQILWSHFICPQISDYIPNNHCEGLNQIFSIFGATTVSAISSIPNELASDNFHDQINFD